MVGKDTITLVNDKRTPTNAEGDIGQVCIDDNFIYICVENKTWKKVKITESGEPGGIEVDPIFSASEAVNFEIGDKAKLDGIEALAEVNNISDANAATLTSDSMADSLHRHSELSASDGSPNPALTIDTSGRVGIGTTAPDKLLHLSAEVTPTIRLQDTTNNKYLDINHGDNYATFDVDSETISYQFQTGGNTKMTLLQNGNVGIGTTAPDVKLQVNDTLQVGGEGAMGIGNQTGILYLGGSSAGPLWYTTSIRTINTDVTPATWKPRMGFFTQAVGKHLAVDQTERMSILSDSGNVGIGTTSPTSKLQVSKDVIANYLTTAQLLLTGSTNTNKTLSLGYDTTNDVGFIEAAISGTGYKPLLINPYGGNVGIGTTSPTSKLHIVGGTTSSDTTLNSNDKIKFRGDGVISWGAAANQGVVSWDTNKVMIGGRADNSLELWTNNSQKMTITTEGNVGIGDSAPGEKLDVNGNANLTGVLKIDDVQILTSQQAHIEDLKTDYVEGDLDTAAEIAAAINATNTKINAILAMLETHGLVATS